MVLEYKIWKISDKYNFTWEIFCFTISVSARLFSDVLSNLQCSKYLFSNSLVKEIHMGPVDRRNPDMQDAIISSPPLIGPIMFSKNVLFKLDVTEWIKTYAYS